MDNPRYRRSIVSPLRPEQIRIVLHPTQVVLFRLARGRARKIIDKHIISCVTQNACNPSWRNAIATLEDALPTFSGRKSHATVILSNHFVRYAMVSNFDRVSTAEEELALIQHHFSRIYGDASTNWSLCISHGERMDQPRVACAIDQELTDNLRILFKSKRAVLRSIQPYLMAAFNQYRHHVQATSWLALVEDGILCLARLNNGHWRSIKCIKTGKEWRRELSILLDREELLSGNSMNQSESHIPVLVFAPEYPQPIDVTPEENADQSISQCPVSILDPSLWPPAPETAGFVHAMALFG